jgi:hypothetical protein
MVAAVTEGLANAYVLMTGGVLTKVADDAKWLYSLRAVFDVVIAGLLRTEVSLRLTRQAFTNRFFTRYLLMVFAVCLGGMLFGLLGSVGV